MYHSGEVVNAMLKVPHITIGKLFFFFFFYWGCRQHLHFTGNICVSR